MKDPNPATVTPIGESTGRRTALATWLTSPDHPLTARVMVNRIRQQHFGRGLVATPNDFGFSGEAHASELLDWLAAELVGRAGRVSEHRLPSADRRVGRVSPLVG